MFSPDGPQQWQEAPAWEGKGSLAGSHHGFLLQGLPTVFSQWPPWLPVLLSHMGLFLVLIGAPADWLPDPPLCCVLPGSPSCSALSDGSHRSPHHVFLLLPLLGV